MKTILTLFATAIMVNLAIAQGAQQVSAKVTLPDLLVLKENSFDFSKIPQGRPVTHDFLLTNPSATDTLKIVNVVASCGCTTPSPQQQTVAPNSTGKISVGYNAYNEGPFTKTITITYNDKRQEFITIKGTVYKAPATAAPENESVDILKKSNQ